METPVHAPFKERVRIEIKKLREMPFKKKMEYIWDYYKISIIVTIVVLLLIGSFINTRFINPPPDTALFVVWSAGFATEEQLDVLSGALKTRIVEEDVNETVVVTAFFAMDEDPNVDMVYIQRLAAMLAAGEIDIFILRSDLLKDYAAIGYLQPMERVLNEIRSADPDAYKRIEEYAVYGNIDTLDGNITEQIIGINVENSPMIKKTNFYVQEMYVGVSASTGKMENVVRALIAMFD